MISFEGWLAGSILYARPAPEVHEECAVLYCGYIANRDALIEESIKRDEAFKQASDGEVFAKAYRWWGKNLQQHVLGEYAVSIFDQRRSSLFLTHDSLGLVPLFYAKLKEGLVFASHLEDLILLSSCDELDEEYIADYLATATVVSPRTPFVGLQRLALGESLYWIDERLTICKVWDIERIEPLILGSDEEYEDRFRAVLREGVLAALRSDGKVWSELSGGLDSSSVVSIAAHSGAGQLEALSIISGSYRSADESEWMKAVVTKYSLPWHTLDADQTLPFAELPQCFCAEPISVQLAPGLSRRYKALLKSHEVGVLLTGSGGDSVLCGGSPRPYFLADFFPLQLKRLSTEFRRWRQSSREGRAFTYLFLRDVFQPFVRHLTHRSLQPHEYALVPTWSHPEYIRAMCLKERSMFPLAEDCPSVGLQYHVEKILSNGFAAASRSDQSTHCFECRKPLMYRPLIEFMLAIPWEQKIQPEQNRYLQRRALRGILPDIIRERKDKGGADQAYAEGLRQENPWTELLLNRPRIVDRGYVDAALWYEAVKRARFGVRSSTKDFLAAVTMEVWLRQTEEFFRHKTPLTPSQLRASYFRVHSHSNTGG